ncbi:class I adenylate-forming enzyme family protein [Nocardioides sp. NPDC059952]|uniref:class I adenylate-forming enzyme family protein n=1 Tax=Nocardioides sp. NPDC059952 TaxID=3347014 RepID=UPI00364846C8
MAEAYTQRPWLAAYRDGNPADIDVEYPSLLAAFRASVARTPDAPVIKYFDGAITFAELDAHSDAVAVALREVGFSADDRLALYVQNNPAFVIGLLAAWKAGGTAVAVNPMNKTRELTFLLKDSEASVLLCLEDLYESVAREVIGSGETAVSTVITCSPLDFQTRNDDRLFKDAARRTPEGTLALAALISEHSGKRVDAVRPDSAAVAVLTYTSGTTGEPKGAMNTHGNLAFNSQTYRDWVGLGLEDSVLGVAPLFHITGLVAHVGVALLAGCPLVLAHRFEPNVVMDAIREHRTTFTVGSVTVFVALTNLDGTRTEDWESFRAILSGGAPIAPALAESLRAKTGRYIYNVYGLTETSSPSHGVPLGSRAPVDPSSGALSVGVPVFNTVVRILDEDGEEVPVGEVGEIATSGPQVVPGYWRRPEATKASMPGGELRTGDVGFMDEAGWFYVVDRKKDMINAAGYKVWPREVEDVLNAHPAVREAAVIGVPDEYRGESVKAFVSLQPGAEASAEELIDHAKQNMAAYKYPRSIEIIGELPKTVTGKILRRELRGQAK